MIYLNRKIIKFLIDLVLLNLSIVLTIFFKYDKIIINSNNLKILFIYNLIFLILYFTLKMYNMSWRFGSFF